MDQKWFLLTYGVYFNVPTVCAATGLLSILASFALIQFERHGHRAWIGAGLAVSAFFAAYATNHCIECGCQARINESLEVTQNAYDLFQKLDVDHSGTLNKDEFCAAADMLSGCGIAEEDAEYAFTQANPNPNPNPNPNWLKKTLSTPPPRSRVRRTPR